MQRIVVVGVAGSGKKQLARCHAIPHIELDRLHWLPGWQSRLPEDVRARVAEAISRESLFLWALQTYRRHRRTYSRLIEHLVKPPSGSVHCAEMPVSM